MKRNTSVVWSWLLKFSRRVRTHLRIAKPLYGLTPVPRVVKVVFSDADGKRERYFTGPVARITFGSNEYQWHQEGEGGHADPDGLPLRTILGGSAETLFQLPKASVTVLRGIIGP